MALSRVQGSQIESPVDINAINITGVATFASAVVTGDLTVQGTTTTLDTTVENVDLLEVGANSAGAAVTITQAGSGDFVNVGTAGSTFKIFNDGRVSINDSSGTTARLHIGNIPDTINQVAFLIDRTDNVTLYSIDYDNASNGVKFRGNTKDYIFNNGSGESETLRITSDGKVGVGSTSPNRLFEIHTTNTTSYSTSDFDQTYNILRLRNSENSKTAGIHFSIGGNGEAAIMATQVGDGQADLAVGTRGGGTRTEKLRINYDGKIGIGVTRPLGTADIEIYGSDRKLRLRDSAATSAAGDVRLEFANVNHYPCAYISHEWTGTAGRLTFHTRTGGDEYERMRINENGQLAVGTVSPSARLDVKHTSNSGALMIVGNNESAGNYGYFQVNCGLIDRECRLGTGYGESFMTFYTQSTFGSQTKRLEITHPGNTIPGADNTYSSGQSGTRWSAVWAANGTIQTSDERSKTQILNSSLGSDFIKSLRPVSYKWKVGKNVVGYATTSISIEEPIYNEDGDIVDTLVSIGTTEISTLNPVEGKRTHWGFIAQEVKQSIDNFGVDFGGWILSDVEDPESEQCLRYDQFIAPIVKCLQESLLEIDILKEEIGTLKVQVGIAST